MSHHPHTYRTLTDGRLGVNPVNQLNLLSMRDSLRPGFLRQNASNSNGIRNVTFHRQENDAFPPLFLQRNYASLGKSEW